MKASTITWIIAFGCMALGQLIIGFCLCGLATYLSVKEADYEASIKHRS